MIPDPGPIPPTMPQAQSVLSVPVRATAWACVAVLRPSLVVAAIAAALAGHAADPGPAVPGALAWILGASAAFGAASGAMAAGFGEGEPPLSRAATLALAVVLMLAAVAAAAQVSAASGWLAIATATATAGFLAGGRQRMLAGPALAGLALGGLYLMGSAPGGLMTAWPGAVAFVLYGMAFGAVARGDGRSAGWGTVYAALGLLLGAVALPVLLGWRDDFGGLAALPFALALALRTLPDFLWAATDPRPTPVQTAQRTATVGVAGLAAALAAGFAGTFTGVILLALMPLSGALERWFGER